MAVVLAFASGVGVAAALPGVAVSAGLLDATVAITVAVGIPSTLATISCSFLESC
jgi:hypothetical protein